MAEIEYPQRWLKEHKAVASERGWERPTTKELLKCQKGLEVTPPEPVLTSVTITGVPATLNVDATGSGSFTVTYSTVDANYEGTSIMIDAVSSGVTLVAKQTMVGKTQEFVVTSGVNGDTITVKATIDGVVSNTIVCTINKTV